MRKKFFILGLVLLTAGTAVRSWIITTEKTQKQQTAMYKAKYSDETDEYLRYYNQWLHLPPIEQADSPLRPDLLLKNKPEQQLRQEQQERLTADLDELATGQKEAYPFADFIYGSNWANELSEYKKHKELAELATAISATSAIVGAVILGSILVTALAKKTLKNVSSIGKYCKKTPQPQPDEIQKTRTSEPKKDRCSRGSLYPKKNAESDSKINAPLSEPKAPQPEDKPEISIPLRMKKTALLEVDETPENIEESLKLQTESLEKQVEELRQLTKNVQQANLGHSAPLTDTLREFSEQISAIREYASQQQDRVKKLQEGYDWNIIKNFCLRIIRSIDSLESRIARLGDENADTSHLKETKDELIFALESSGIEQFEPELYSDYFGQEKRLEVIKDKEPCEDADLVGKVAKVIRPGYCHIIDEENVKVIRTAQVKLFG